MPSPTWDAERVSPDHIRQSAAICKASFVPALEADWSVPAGPLDWTCRETLDHVNDALCYYCGQLATRSPVRRAPFRNGNPGSSTSDLLDSIESIAAILATIATASSPDDRAYHRMGMSDAEGFLAMGCEEVLIHAWDIGQGLGLHVTVPDDLAGAVVRRLFPWAPTNCAAWEAQLWCSDRIELPGQGKIGKWGWHGAPIAEWDGQRQPATVFG